MSFVSPPPCSYNASIHKRWPKRIHFEHTKTKWNTLGPCWMPNAYQQPWNAIVPSGASVVDSAMRRCAHKRLDLSPPMLGLWALCVHICRVRRSYGSTTTHTHTPFPHFVRYINSVDTLTPTTSNKRVKHDTISLRLRRPTTIILLCMHIVSDRIRRATNAFTFQYSPHSPPHDMYFVWGRVGFRGPVCNWPYVTRSHLWRIMCAVCGRAEYYLLLGIGTFSLTIWVNLATDRLNAFY